MNKPTSKVGPDWKDQFQSAVTITDPAVKKFDPDGPNVGPSGMQKRGTDDLRYVYRAAEFDAAFDTMVQAVPAELQAAMDEPRRENSLDVPLKPCEWVGLAALLAVVALAGYGLVRLVLMMFR